MKENFIKASSNLETLSINIVESDLNISVLSVCVFSFFPGEVMGNHAHSFIEIHYVAEGKGTVILGGKKFDLSPGSFFITGPNVNHQQSSDTESPMIEYGMKCSIDINMHQGMTPDQFETLEELNMVKQAILSKNDQVVEDEADIKGAFERIFEEAYHKKVGYMTMIKKGIFELLVAAARNMMVSHQISYSFSERELNQYRVRRADEYIADNIQKNITAFELARYLNLSYKQLCRIIKSETGLNAYEWILRKKVERAIDLLKITDKKLLEVAQLTGFSSEYHLSKVIKKVSGNTPTYYRKQYHHTN